LILVSEREQSTSLNSTKFGMSALIDCSQWREMLRLCNELNSRVVKEWRLDNHSESSASILKSPPNPRVCKLGRFSFRKGMAPERVLPARLR